MAEIKNIVFGHVEIAEMLVKQQGIHDGHWGIYMEFGLAGGNVPTPPDNAVLVPAAIAFVHKIGIQKFDVPNNLTVDASIVNPRPKSR